jgi:iron complex transport system ATP-binding protein
MCTEARLSDLYGISMKRLDHGAGPAQTSNIVANYGSIDR